MRIVFMVAVLTGCDVRPNTLEVPYLVADVVLDDIVPIGQESAVPVAITNRGTATARATVRTTEGLRAPDWVVIAPGETRNLPVRVSPSSGDAIEATLTLDTAYQTLAVAVRATVNTDVDNDGFTARAADGTDCDDRDPLVFPGAVERCNNRDDDCDGVIDEDVVDARLWYRDHDRDGFGVDDDTLTACAQPPVYAPRGGDCDDTDATVNPAATERYYDGVDQDCDGLSDYDADGDGFDSLGHGGLDCRDSDPESSPEGFDRPGDGLDQDCDGWPDERVPAAGELVITEVHPEPVVGPQYIELVSRTNSALSLDGLGIVATTASVVPGRTAIGPFATWVVCDEPAEFCDVVIISLDLSGAAELRIGVPALDVAPLASLPWSAGVSAEYPGLPSPLANDDPADWCAATAQDLDEDAGTPGDSSASCEP